MLRDNQQQGKTKTILIFVLTIIVGFILFVLPNLFFGITKINGGLSGINLAIIGVTQFALVSSLIFFSLKKLKMNFGYIGLTVGHWKRDSLIGLGVTFIRVLIDFGLVIPNTGGSERADIQEAINGLDGTVIGLISFIVLGVVGGGITEEIYNRGFFISVMKDLFRNPKVGIWIAVVVSILFFAVGHMPTNTLEWVDILIASAIYTGLLILTKRLTASIVAHGAWNMTSILIINYMYQA